jgi:hypothetical protein
MKWGDVVRSGCWTEWPGLPPRLTEPELLAALDFPDATRGSARLGRQRLERVEAGEDRYWLEDETVKLVELVDPPSELPALELLAALGPAERETSGRHMRFDASTVEHVYPARGLSVTVAHGFDTPEAFIAQVLLFAPTDLTRFVTELGGNDRPGPGH